ncbi:MAG: DNA topoisomerase [Eubacteriales bacterium]
MTIIIAEKPSLAKNIAAAIGQMSRRDGYLEGRGPEGQGYLVSWVFGHLFSLVDVEAYEAGEGNRFWTMDNLPCFPKEFRYELRKGPDKQVDPGVKRQFELLRALCNRADVERIVNAGDADREGEIIVRTCVKHALGAPKPLFRLWLPDQTPQTIRQALAELPEQSRYDSLANEGYARTYIDWLYGVNLTRLATLQCRKLLRVGRVIVPIVKAIYDRDKAIAEFVPEPYLAIVSKTEVRGETVELVSTRRFAMDRKKDAEALCREYQARGAVVVDRKTKKETISAGKLYSLSTLQNKLGRRYKMSMKDSLDILQGLYEKGYVTYPRTNSEYVATAERDKIKEVLGQVRKAGYRVSFRADKTIFDDAKIESHSALTPTYRIPDKGALTEREALVYGAVLRRFAAVFCEEPCTAEKTTLTIAVGEQESFTLKGTVLLTPGWTRYDEYTPRDKLLPALQVGEAVPLDFQPLEKTTTPPRHYTIETLNNYLKNPFREEKAKAGLSATADAAGGAGTAGIDTKDGHTTAAPSAEEGAEDDTAEYRAIFEGLELGTEATRTGIIDNAKKSGYIALNKDVYTILPDGKFLIESLLRMNINMDKYKTAELGRALKRIYHGTLTVPEGVRLAEAEIVKIFEPYKKRAKPTPADTGKLGEIVGRCPLCGANVIRGKRAYGCMGYLQGCRFRMPDSLCGRGIGVGEARQLLRDGQTPTLSGFLSRHNKPFSAALLLEAGKVRFSFQQDTKGTGKAPREPDSGTEGTAVARAEPRPDGAGG